jgi:DNA-binding transcriptional ArsR family regulator/uncharacterized protein YndB with AHSA1/START domain
MMRLASGDAAAGGERDVWSALANPVRRSVLDLLRDGPRTTGELANAFPQLSRFAVMQHLSVLEQAGLLLARRRGRHRLNHLNVAPLQEIRERWLHGFGEEAGRAALALRRHLEAGARPRSQSHDDQTTGQGDDEMESTVTEDPTTTQAQARAVRIESELRIGAPPERVFRALTEEQHEWYPYNYGGERVRTIVFEPRVGGGCYEDWGDGAGHFYGTVTHYDPPRAFTLRGGLAGSTVLDNAFTLVAQPDGSTIVQHSMTAFGDLTDDEVHGIRVHGNLALFEDHLRAWVEQGIAVERT